MNTNNLVGLTNRKHLNWKLTFNFDVRDLVIRLEFQLDTFSYASSPEDWEHLLEDFQKFLHDNHYICMKTKRILLQIYGARDGYHLQQLSRKQLDRKIFLCRNYIEIFSVLEPGYRTWKGRLLEELLGPLTITLHQERMQYQKCGKDQSPILIIQIQMNIESSINL